MFRDPRRPRPAHELVCSAMPHAKPVELAAHGKTGKSDGKLSKLSPKPQAHIHWEGVKKRVSVSNYYAADV